MRNIINFKAITLKQEGDAKVVAIAWRSDDGVVTWDAFPAFSEEMIDVLECYCGGASGYFSVDNVSKAEVRANIDRLMAEAKAFVAKTAPYMG